MKSRTFYVVILIILIALLSSCEDVSKKEISLDEVNSVTVNQNRNGINYVIYTRDSNVGEIEEFLKAYNEAQPYDNKAGIASPYTIVIKLSSGEQISVFGGAQEFQTVQIREKQINVKGEKLRNYFRDIENKYKI